MLFQKCGHDKMFLQCGNKLGHTLTSQLISSSDLLNITISHHTKNPNLCFCKCCKVVESRRHTFLYVHVLLIKEKSLKTNQHTLKQ